MKVCQTFCLFEQKVRQAFQTCQTCRFRNLVVNQTQIPSLPRLPFSELAPIKHTPSYVLITRVNLNLCHTAPESNKQNPRDGTINLPSFFQYKHITLETIFRLYTARVCPTGFEATSAVMFALIHLLREFPLSVIANRFEFKCQLKQLLLLYYKIFSCYSREVDTCLGGGISGQFSLLAGVRAE